MNRWFNTVSADKPLIVQISNWRKHIKDNLLFVIVCFISVLLHIHPILSPVLIIGDEALHLTNGLWIYEYIGSGWHVYFQILFWLLIGVFVIIGTMKIRVNSFSEKWRTIFSRITSNNSMKSLIVVLLLSFLFTYFYLLRNLTYYPMLVRYPPVSKFLYFFTYAAFGISHIFPRILQLIFYLLCAGYLYRTINLFYDKETALAGASIYLFLPVTFVYASLGEIESGVIFLIAAISFYFIRFMKDRDNRDLLLTAYLIGIGYLYKDPVLLVLPVCVTFLVFQKIRNRQLNILPHLRILSLALATVIPWMIIAKKFSWRNYTFQMSNFTSLESKAVTYFLLISSNISALISILFVSSVIYLCFIRRDTLISYFGLLFVVYYFFIVSDMGALSPRFSMAFYPTITVFLSLFIFGIIRKIKWRHAGKICFIVITAYLIIISSVSPLNTRYLTGEHKKLYYYPSDKSMKWVKENVKEGEKVLAIRILSSKFYRHKYAIDRDKIIDLLYDIESVSTPEKLKKFCGDNKISYILFPYSAAYIKNDIRVGIFEYLQENPNNEFTEVAKYNLDENFIYIYKLRED